MQAHIIHNTTVDVAHGMYSSENILFIPISPIIHLQPESRISPFSYVGV